jgi:outer membrane protein OmpA-like peptidoglycan-associated protein
MTSRRTIMRQVIYLVGYITFFSLTSIPAVFATENFGYRTPTEEELIEALDPPKTRALRPSKTPPEPPSVSMQINFSLNSVEISADSMRKVENLANALKDDRLSSKSMRVVGHTDASGSESYNMELSRRRAQAVREQLIQLGVSPTRLETAGKGKNELLNKQNPLAGENRRVQFVILAN